jgi:hypothetical protein
MKVTRLSLLMLALVASVIAAPEAFGAKMKGALGAGTQSQADCTWYSITCSNGKTDTCCGDVTSCLDYCSRVCGGPCRNNTGEEEAS